MTLTDEELLQRIPIGDVLAVSRLITLLENGSVRARSLLAKLYPATGKAHVIGVTGAPGAGKSTLVDELALVLHKAGHKVAVLAVDPSSPFSGGAILGDRIRMNRASEHKGIFIRSMATRGALGGVANAAYDAITVLDAAGFDRIIIETVGVGQAEVDIVETADTCLVVVVPGMGDSVQSLKAGILEIADLFVINKSDREGSDLVHKDLRVLISLIDYAEESWKPQIVSTIATKGEGVPALLNAIEDHKNWLLSSAPGKEKKLHQMMSILLKTARDQFSEKLESVSKSKLRQYATDCLHRQTHPSIKVRELMKQVNGL